MSNMRKKVLMALAGAAVALTGCAAEQPSPGCYVQDGNWVLRYANAQYSGNCTGTQLTTFQRYQAETTGVFKFKEIGAQGGSLVLRPRRAGVYGAQDTDPSSVNSGVFPNNEKANATGTLPDQPTGEGTERFCVVGDMTPIDVPNIAGTAQMKYQYTNVRVYSGARSLGTQLSARVHVEDIQAAGTCIMDADVYGVWPGAVCDPEAMGDAEADPHDNCGFGSLMNQDVAYACVDAGVTGGPPANTPPFRCVPAGPTPSYKPDVEEFEYAE